MKIGIWCDYNQTLGPTEGIGVFIDSLTRGIIEADSDIEIVLKCNASDFEVMDPLVDFGRGRIQVQCDSKPRFVDRKLVRFLTKIDCGIEEKFSKEVAVRLNPIRRLVRLGKAFFERRAYSVYDRTVDSCDVWLIPYVGLQVKLNAPNIVIVHDLVCCHFPEMMSVKQLSRFMSGVRSLVENADFAVSMSQYIKETDIKGVLQVPDEKIRVLKSAVPHDIVNMTDLVNGELPNEIKSRLGGAKYLLYPAAFRSYKNHELLVEVIRKLKERGESDWKVVFTGISTCPKELRDVIRNAGVGDQVEILGKVDRNVLALLYGQAFATVVPSRYEQGSFPIMEAVSMKCPAIASDIPALREQFQSFGDAMLFADPDSVDELINKLDVISISRDDIINRQQIAFKEMAVFTWKDAALQWLDLFRETIHLDRNKTTNK